MGDAKKREAWRRKMHWILADDALSLVGIVRDATETFGMSSASAEAFVRSFLREIFAAGARPLTVDAGRWVADTGVPDDPDAAADQMIEEWRAMGRPPDLGDRWFGRPGIV